MTSRLVRVCLLPTALGPALLLRQIANAVGEHRAHVVGRDLVLARFFLLRLEFLGLLQRERVAQRCVGGAGVARGERGHGLFALCIGCAGPCARDRHRGRVDHAQRGAALVLVFWQAAPTQLVAQHIGQGVDRHRRDHRATAVAHAHRLALGLCDLGVGEIAVSQAAGGEAVLVGRGAAGDGRALQVGVADDMDVEAAGACGDAALFAGAVEVVVDPLLGRAGRARDHIAVADGRHTHVHVQARTLLLRLVVAAVLRSVDV